MTDYLDNFTILESGSVEDCYGWRGWTIYWDKHAHTGELYNPNGEFHTAGDSLEALAEEVAWHEEDES